MSDGCFKDVKACVFDAYGTLFDVHSAVGGLREEVGARHAELSLGWRTKQLEYTWLRSLMGAHEDFWQLTSDALDYAMEQCEIKNAALHEKLMQAYLSLTAFSEVNTVLDMLNRAQVPCAILTNGSPMMIEAAVKSAGIGEKIQHNLSVESAGIFKPDARVYQLAVDALKVRPEQIAFQSSNAWDAAGAAHFGFQVAWINRYAQPRERLPGTPVVELSDLNDLPGLLGIC